MLYLLTGDIRTGKTSWLEALVERLVADGVEVAGVLAPGVWRATGASASGPAYEKIAIDNVLLPGGERIRLGARRDLAGEQRLLLDGGDVVAAAEGRGADAAASVDVAGAAVRSRRVGLDWVMSDEALARADGHLAQLARRGARSPRSLLIIDELGILELRREGGLQSGVELLSRGPAGGWPNVLAVVRRELLPLAHARFDVAWDGAVKEIRATTGGVLV